MNTPVKLAGFVAGLAVALAASYGVGSAVGPIGVSTDSGEHQMDDMNDTAAPQSPSSDEKMPGGLMVAESGYRLRLGSGILPQGRTQVSFEVLGPDGEAVTEYATVHGKQLHLIVVRRDTTRFQHVHPTLAADGTWTVDVDLTPGVWRFYADFTPSELGENLTLGADVSVDGDYDPQPLPAATRTAQVDGYEVTLGGELAAGGSNELTLTVTKDGRPVTDLQPYLGAYGHLVVLRADDLAYLHVHPDGEPGDGTTEAGPAITFYATVPSTGWYRLYLDFLHDGTVRTAEFTVEATETTPAHGSAGHGSGHGS